jgi:FkbM family methyltransferase
MKARPTELREEYLKGAVDKHEFARRISDHYLTLGDFASLLAGSDVSAIELTADGVSFVSRFGNARFPCDPADRGIPPIVACNFGQYEPKDFTMLLQLVRPGAVFLDIGANIGWYSVHVAVRDPLARVIAVEPIPSSYRWLVAAIAANNLPNVTAINAAVGAEPGTMTLFVDPTISGAASAAPSTGPEGLQRVECPVSTIDDIVAERGGTVDVVKLDIEGAELLALEGGTRTLAAHHPIVFCEMLRKLTKPFGYHPNDIIALMRGHGYECFRAESGRLVPFAIMDEETVETNFYFLHSQSHSFQRAELGAMGAISARAESRS